MGHEPNVSPSAGAAGALVGLAMQLVVSSAAAATLLVLGFPLWSPQGQLVTLTLAAALTLFVGARVGAQVAARSAGTRDGLAQGAVAGALLLLADATIALAAAAVAARHHTILGWRIDIEALDLAALTGGLAAVGIVGLVGAVRGGVAARPRRRAVESFEQEFLGSSTLPS
jgi:hypothetical protein